MVCRSRGTEQTKLNGVFHGTLTFEHKGVWIADGPCGLVSSTMQIGQWWGLGESLDVQEKVKQRREFGNVVKTDWGRRYRRWNRQRGRGASRRPAGQFAIRTGK
jgi:hypothetical protein